MCSTPVPHAVSPQPGPAVRRYAFAVLVVGLALGLRWLLHGVLGEQAPFLLFVPAVLLASWLGGLGPGLLATALSSTVVSYAFLAPLGSLAASGTAALVQLALFTGIGVTISLLSGRLRRADTRALRRLQALEASEERFRLLVEGVEDYAIYMLDPEGRIVLWNRGAERIKGYRSEEILGRHLSLFYSPEEREAAGRHMQEAAERGHIQEEGVRVRKDGSRFLAHVTLTALRDAQGNLRGFAKITRDITERRQAEEEIRLLADTLEQRVIQRTAQLEEANQALQAFAYSVSHDLRPAGAAACHAGLLGGSPGGLWRSPGGDRPRLRPPDRRSLRADGPADQRPPGLQPPQPCRDGAADPDVDRALDLGANSYLLKPVGFDALLEIVRLLDLYWLTLNERPNLR
jgi:PAS domain S-box-containing protein